MKYKTNATGGSAMRKLKKTIAAVLAAALGMLIFVTPAAAEDRTLTAAAMQADAGTGKTETVYASLNADGSVGGIYVVNHLMGSYTDYGTYTEIKNLSTLSVPVVSGDKITFTDENTGEGLFYQGTAAGELPMTFGLRYELNGRAVDAQSLAGASGHLKIVMDYAPNQRCGERVRSGLMAQVSAAFDSGRAANVSAENATLVTVGSTVSVSFIAMPDESGSWTMQADVTDFEMDPITITLLKGALSISGVTDSIGEFEDGMDDMIGGADDMVSGTTELKDGMKTLAGKAGKLGDGLTALSDAGVLLGDGMVQYGAGLDTYVSGVQALGPASAQIRAGLEELASGGATAASGVAAVSGNLSALAAGAGDLSALAAALASSPDDSVRNLAGGVLALIGGVQGLSDGLETASEGLSGYADGVDAAAQGYAAFDDGVAELAGAGTQVSAGFGDIQSGFEPYRQGVTQSAQGFNKLYLALKGLPTSVQELIDGQQEFKDGIASAKDEFADKTQDFMADSEPAVSFASPDKNHPASVQYILTTPGVKIKKAERQEPEQQEADVLTRLADLFK